MKTTTKTVATFALLAIGTVSATMVAKTLKVTEGNLTYLFEDAQTGAMLFSEGKTLEVQGKTFDISSIKEIAVTDDESVDNQVTVTYSEGHADIEVAGNIAKYITATVDGAHVSLTQSDEVGDDTCGEITYILTGEASDGGFTITGGYKCSIELHGVTLTNPSGAAIDIQNGKRTAIRVQENTVNTLIDGASGSQKACLYSKGHMEFKQKGTLNVIGNKAHAISAKEEIEIKNTKINITAAEKDGLNCNRYFLMESGELNISGTKDDGIQVAYKDSENREAEDTGSITIKGGTITADVTCDAAKAIKCEGDFTMSKGTINATVSGGGLWDADKVKTKASACIGVDGNVDISGGTFTLRATGGGGKGINVDGKFVVSGGTIDITTSGGLCAYVSGKINNSYTGNADNLKSDYKSSPKGIKCDGGIEINGGKINIYTKGASGEGMESKTTLTINDGDITIRAYEDGTNSSSHTYINGGTLTVTTGTGDAIDSNGAIYVTGGRICVIGAGGSEQGFDAGDGYTIYITGGEILAAGGGNSAPTTSTSTQAYVTLTQAVNAGETVQLKDGDTVLLSFVVPDKYSSTAASAPKFGPGGWGWGGTGSGSALLLSCPEMVSGKTYTIVSGTTTTTSTAKTTGGSTGPGIR